MNLNNIKHLFHILAMGLLFWSSVLGAQMSSAETNQVAEFWKEFPSRDLDQNKQAAQTLPVGVAFKLLKDTWAAGGVKKLAENHPRRLRLRNSNIPVNGLHQAGAKWEGTLSALFLKKLENLSTADFRQFRNRLAPKDTRNIISLLEQKHIAGNEAWLPRYGRLIQSLAEMTAIEKELERLKSFVWVFALIILLFGGYAAYAHLQVRGAAAKTVEK